MEAATCVQMGQFGFYLLALLLGWLLLWVVVVRGRWRRRWAVGFFHPFTDGGGGEWVLWCAIRANQEEFPGVDITDYSQLHNKTSLTSLTLKWNTDGHGGAKEQTSEDVLQAFLPCTTLPQLCIYGYPGCTVLTWLGNSTALPMLSGLQELCLERWGACTDLPALGNLPELRRLQIQALPKVRRVGAEWFGSNHGFPKLVCLSFGDMAEWEDWDILFTFPCLSLLDIWNCPKLRSLPPIFSTLLREIHVRGCPNLESLPQEMASLKQLQALAIWNCPKLKESCNKEGAQWYKIQHIPHIEIYSEDVLSSDDDE